MKKKDISAENSKRLENAIKFREVIKIIFEIPDETATIWIMKNLREKMYMIKKKCEQKTDDYCFIYNTLFQVQIKDINTMILYIKKRMDDMNIRSRGLRSLDKINWSNKKDVKGSFAMLCSYVDEFKRLNEATMLLLEIRC